LKLNCLLAGAAAAADTTSSSTKNKAQKTWGQKQKAAWLIREPAQVGVASHWQLSASQSSDLYMPNTYTCQGALGLQMENTLKKTMSNQSKYI